MYDGNDKTSPVQWRKVYKNDKCFKMDRKSTEDILGLETYLDRYGQQHDGINLRNNHAAQSDLEHWKCIVPFKDGDVTILCCPEDRRCNACQGDDNQVDINKPLCEECEVRTWAMDIDRQARGGD